MNDRDIYGDGHGFRGFAQKPAMTGITPAMNAKEVFAISRDEILLGRNVAWRHFSRMMDAVDGLVAAFEDGRFAEIKAASEKISDAAHAASTTTRQIEGLAMSLTTGCTHQLNRRSR